MCGSKFIYIYIIYKFIYIYNQDKFLVCANTLGNKASSDSDSIIIG